MCRKILQRLLTKIGREIQGIENINVHNNGMTIALGQCTVDETCRQQVAASEECRAASRQLALPTPGVGGEEHDAAEKGGQIWLLAGIGRSLDSSALIKNEHGITHRGSVTLHLLSQ